MLATPNKNFVLASVKYIQNGLSMPKGKQL